VQKLYIGLGIKPEVNTDYRVAPLYSVAVATSDKGREEEVWVNSSSGLKKTN